MATTHTEVYRRFDGELAPHPLRFLPLFLSELRVATRRKLPLVILYGPLAIGTIVACFAVYAKFMLEGGTRPEGFQMAMAASMASSLLDVRNLIVQYFVMMALFALLATTWYGSGMICEDRRVNAHLLYFARPLTRLDYFLGKLCAAGAFGAFGVFVPSFLICLMAVLCSPSFSFLTEQWDVFVGMTAFSAIWMFTVGSLVLAASSVASKRVFAMVLVFGFVMLSTAFALIADDLGGIPFVSYAGLLPNLAKVGEWILSPPGSEAPEGLSSAIVGVLAVVGVSLLLVFRRLREMELRA